MLGVVMRKMVLMTLEMEVREKLKEKSAVPRKAVVKLAMAPVPKKRFRSEALSVKEVARARLAKAIKEEVKQENPYDGAVAEAEIGGQDEAGLAETQLKLEVKHESESDVDADAEEFQGHFAEAV